MIKQYWGIPTSEKELNRYQEENKGRYGGKQKEAKEAEKEMKQAQRKSARFMF